VQLDVFSKFVLQIICTKKLKFLSKKLVQYHILISWTTAMSQYRKDG